MKLSNFVITEKGIHGYTGSVSVTTGHLWWRKTETRPISWGVGGFWYFTDTGNPIARALACAP
jgi:hypothetical protein